MISNLRELELIHQKHIDYRSKCLNLIASENLVSPRVRSYLTSEFGHRYGCYPTLKPEKRKYRGNRYIHEFEIATHDLVKEVFDADYVDLRPIGGQIAGVSTVLGLLEPGDLVLEVSMKDWGHGLVTSMLNTGHFKQTIKVDWLPYDNDQILEMSKLVDLIQKHEPKLIIFGGSGTLFPDPVEEIKDIVDAKGIWLAYDASHVTGLIAGGIFPNPLDQGVDVMFGSIHKTFPGPQGGIVTSRIKEPMKKIGDVISPGLVSSHHLNRLPSFAAALLEMKKYGEDYSHQIVKNSRALGKALDKRGFNVIASTKGYTDTHILLMDVTAFGSSLEISLLLEEANILCSSDFGQNIGQIRLGTSEVTRRGMKEPEMEEIADFIGRVLLDREDPVHVRADVESYKDDYSDYRYCLDSK